LVVIDHNKNIQRIVDKILADTSLFDSGKTEGLLRDVFFGDPENQKKEAAIQKPYLYVSTRNATQTTRYNFGVIDGGNINQQTVEYELTIIAQSGIRTVASQKQLYDIIKNLRTLVETDPTFLKPVSLDDPVFSRSIISEAPWDTKMKGKLITSITLILLATIGTAFTLTVVGIANPIKLLSKPSAPEGIFFDENKEQSGKRVGTELGDFGAIFAEYECNETINAVLRAKFGNEESVTLSFGTDSRILNVLFVDISPTVAFDAIERCVLHLEILKT